MLVSDVMTTNVISIPSNTSLSDARRILDAHRIRRVPVVDRGKLVGIVSKEDLDRSGPSQLTTFSIHEIGYLLSKITVKEVMHRDVVTVTPDMTVEEAVALAQEKKVGGLIVVEGTQVAGICTTNDFFYRILNPILGIGLPGSRIVIRGCYKTPDILKAVTAISKLNIGITNLFLIDFPPVKKHDMVVHMDTPDSSKVITELAKLGYSVEARKR